MDHATSALRLGLCCQFAREPIKFRTTTVTAMLRLNPPQRLARLAELCQGNADALMAALQYCAKHDIGTFRIISQILPVKTHPTAGYDVAELPGSAGLVARFRERGEFARQHNLRLSFHPDQFHLSSPLEGWDGPKPERHHDYINVADFPREWRGWPLTVEVEAKAKELAVTQMLGELRRI